MGFPDGAGLDVLGFVGEADVFSGGAEFVGVDSDAGQPAVRVAVGGFGHEGEAEITWLNQVNGYPALTAFTPRDC